METVRLEELEKLVKETVWNSQVTDMHTHLFSPVFGDLLIWGFDELMTYHYLVAEAMRWLDMPYEQFWSLSKEETSELIWKTLFIDNTPCSEACKGVLTVLKELGLDVKSRNISTYRKYFQGLKLDDYVDEIFQIAKVKCVVMTNDPFDAVEHQIWQTSYKEDPRFKTALRLDVLLNSWNVASEVLKGRDYDVEDTLSSKTLKEIRRFLEKWIYRMEPLYMAVSLPANFNFPDDSPTSKIIKSCILPVSYDLNVPLALMIGVKRSINPSLKLAGDSVGRSNVESIEYLCANYPNNKFMVTMLSRENQHELAVTARKFRNLMVFGCWWFLNNPSIIGEITNMRFELLGMSFIPQHSDSRVLEHLIYKWSHSRKIIADILIEKYKELLEKGWTLSLSEIQRDVDKLLGGNFWSFLER